MNFIKNIVVLGAGFKIGSIFMRKIAYKFFLRKSIYKDGMKVI
jgi:hypothetical protein